MKRMIIIKGASVDKGEKFVIFFLPEISVLPSKKTEERRRKKKKKFHPFQSFAMNHKKKPSIQPTTGLD